MIDGKKYYVSEWAKDSNGTERLDRWVIRDLEGKVLVVIDGTEFGECYWFFRFTPIRTPKKMVTANFEEARVEAEEALKDHGYIPLTRKQVAML